MYDPVWRDAFDSVKHLHRGNGRDVFAACRLKDRRAVVLKVFAAGADGRTRAQREFDALRACRHPSIPAAIELMLEFETPCLVLERLDGIAIQSWIETNGPVQAEVALELAIHWADALAAVHRARIVHCDVTPNNLLICPRTHATYLVDFGISARLGTRAGAESADAAKTGLEGTLQYIAPEQTGRMNRQFGFQSDLYGLGGVLYFVLTGQPPFPHTDVLELIHAHIARHPIAPDEVRPEVPAPLSGLVLKLLAKEPSDRYASARSLHSDLLVMRNQLLNQGAIALDFQLEATEIPDRPRYPTTLYGRDRETSILCESLERAIGQGPRVVFVRGQSGAGKSALIDHFRRRLSGQGAYLLQGSFDPLRERPYAGLAGCLESFAAQVLIESDDRLGAWRTALTESLGAIAGALTAIAPDLGAVFGSVPELPHLDPRETHARLRLAVQRFIEAVATPEHPMVLCLDEFQSSDSASQALLEELFAYRTQGRFLALVLWQEPEPHQVNGTEDMRRKLSALGVPIDDVQMGPLDAPSLVAFLADTLGADQAAVSPLATHIQRKTGGNPLWVRQLLDHLHEQGCIDFKPGQGWQWDIDRVAGASIPDGASSLLVARLARLAPSLQTTLSHASCAGPTFSLALLGQLSTEEPHQIEENLWKLESEGLLLPATDGFRFAHERVRDAARQTLSSASRAEIHAKVARWMLETPVDQQPGDSLLELADQLILAAQALPSELEAERISRCLEAGRQVLGSGAAKDAKRYLDVARTHFCDADWAIHQRVGMALWISSAEASLLSGDPDGALALLCELQPHAAGDMDTARIEQQRLLALGLTQPAAACVSHALRVLRQWGVRWPLHPSKLRAWFALRSGYARSLARARLGAKAPGGTLSSRRLAALIVIGAVGGVISRTDARLGALVTCYALRKPMPSALAMREAYSAAHYGLWIQCVLGDGVRAKEIADAGRRWMKETDDRVLAPRLETSLGCSFDPIHLPRRRALASIDQILEKLDENGDLEFAYYARFLKPLYLLLGGEPIDAMRQTMASVVDEVRRVGARYVDPARCLAVMETLADPDLVGPRLDDVVSEYESRMQTEGDGAEAWDGILWGLALCVLGRHELTWRVCAPIHGEMFLRAPYIHVAHYLLYRGVAAAVLAKQTRGRIYRRAFREALRALERWARLGPDLPHMLLLLRAERARLRGRMREAHTLYDQSARGAVGQEFVHHAALAKERRGQLLLEARRATEGNESLRQALQLYERWGAVAKVRLLLRTYPSLR